MEDSAMDIDPSPSSYYSRLGKRSFSAFEHDNIPEPRQPLIYIAGLEAPVEPKAMQLYRTCVVYVSMLAGHSYHIATRGWTWLFGLRQTPTPAPTEIVSVESDTAHKRRAITRDAAHEPTSPSPPTASPMAHAEPCANSPPSPQSSANRTWLRGQKAPCADDTSDEEEQYHMSGALAAAKTQKQDLPSPPNSQDDEPNNPPHTRPAVEAPGAFPQPSKRQTPPESRPTSSHEAIHKMQTLPRGLQPQARTTSRTYTAKTLSTQVPSQPTRPTSLAAKMKPEYGMSLSRFRADQIAIRGAKTSSTSPASVRKMNTKLPRQAREAIRQQREEARDAQQKKHERQNQKDADIENLISRAKLVSIESPEVRNIRSEFRKSKQLREAKVEEEQRLEREKIKREEEEARVKIELEEEAKRQAEREAEEERRRSEGLVPHLSGEWEDRLATALATDNAKKILAKSVEGVELSKYDLERLYDYRASTWLNDETVNAWFAALVKKKNEQMGREYKRGSPTVPYAAAYNTMWFANYKTNGINSVKNWSRRKGIQGKALLQAEKIYFPINTGAHWTLLVVSPTARTIEFLDSLGGRDRYGFKAARQWLAMELGDAFKPEEWSEMDGISSSQLNGDDCGVFACVNGYASIKGVDFDQVESVKGMMDARRWMVAVLLNGGFEGEFDL